MQFDFDDYDMVEFIRRTEEVKDGLAKEKEQGGSTPLSRTLAVHIEGDAVERYERAAAVLKTACKDYTDDMIVSALVDLGAIKVLDAFVKTVLQKKREKKPLANSPTLVAN